MNHPPDKASPFVYFLSVLGNILLAIEIKVDFLVIDERDGRVVARQTGLRVGGVLGVLLRTKATGGIPSIKAEIKALRSRAGFLVAP